MEFKNASRSSRPLNGFKEQTRVPARANRVSIAQTPGRAGPIGATVVDGGVNFSMFSRHASGVDLLFFDRDNDPQPARTIALDPVTNRTYYYWHTFVPDVEPGQVY